MNAGWWIRHDRAVTHGEPIGILYGVVQCWGGVTWEETFECLSLYFEDAESTMQDMIADGILAMTPFAVFAFLKEDDPLTGLDERQVKEWDKKTENKRSRRIKPRLNVD